MAFYLGSAVIFSDIASWYSTRQILSSYVFATVITISCSAAGLYRRTLDKKERRPLGRILFSFLLAIFLLFFIHIIFHDYILMSGMMTVLLTFAGLFLSRSQFNRIVNLETLKRRILVIGCDNMANRLQRINSNYLYNGFKIVGFAHLGNKTPVTSDTIVIKDNGDITKVCQQLRVDEIVIAIDDKRNKLPVDELLDIKISGISVVDLLTFYEREQQLIFLESLTPSWLVFSDGFTNKNNFRSISKRICDILASLLLLIVSWWVMLLAALAISIESGWGAPILYWQVRVGQNNKLFSIIKFRSMHPDAEKNGVQWTNQYDDRVTKVGQFIRKYRIDELPQLFNVIKGEMSFVGPRPERPEFVEGFVKKIPYYKERHCVKPGITGWAQLCYPYGANEDDTRRKLEYDLYYVKNYTLFLDLMIILNTIEVILMGEGAR